MPVLLSRILSEFHFSCKFIDGLCFRSVEALHGEFSFKLGLPSSYSRNWTALLDCLSSIGDKRKNLCSHWDWVDDKRLVLSIGNFSAELVDKDTLLAFLQVVADANERLAKSGRETESGSNTTRIRPALCNERLR